MSAIPGIPDEVRFLPDAMADPVVRERVTPATIKATIRVLDAWRVTSAQASALMGMPARTWFRLKAGERAAALSQDEITRASYLIGTYKGLHLLFDAPLCDEWPTLANTGSLFEGRSPVDEMIRGGIPAMVAVRRHVDALRGGL